MRVLAELRVTRLWMCLTFIHALFQPFFLSTATTANMSTFFETCNAFPIHGLVYCDFSGFF